MWSMFYRGPCSISLVEQDLFNEDCRIWCQSDNSEIELPPAGDLDYIKSAVEARGVWYLNVAVKHDDE